MPTVLLLLMPTPYAAAAAGYLDARRRGDRSPDWARLLGRVAALAHLVALVWLGARTHASPFRTDGQALSFLAFSLAGLYGLIEATSRVSHHGGGFYLLAATLAAAGVPSLAVEGARDAAERTRDPALSLHVGFALLGTAAILAGGLLAAAYLRTYRRMKRGRIGIGAAGEMPLAGLERLARHASAAGVLLLGPSLVLGGVVANRDGSLSPWAVAEIAVSAVQFLAVAIAAFLWWRRPLRGAIAAWLNVGATAVAVAGFAVLHPLLAAAGKG